ncbi:unnamed protein product, partial [Linum tenue]
IKRRRSCLRLRPHGRHEHYSSDQRKRSTLAKASGRSRRPFVATAQGAASVRRRDRGRATRWAGSRARRNRRREQCVCLREPSRVLHHHKNQPYPSVKAMRINDCFGWSKYGVRVPQEMICKSTATLWNRVDMFTGETMMDVGGMARAAEEAKELRRSLEEERLELAVCKMELGWMKKNESLWSKLVEDKENQLQAFKAALREALG